MFKGKSTLWWLLGLTLLLSLIAWENKTSQHGNLSFSEISDLIRGEDFKPGDRSLLQLQSFDRLDQQAAALKYSGTDVNELASQLEALSRTDMEKARAIFIWIAHNISYDTEMVFTDRVRPTFPEEALQTRKAVCSGYSILFHDLAKAMGLEARVISGYARGASEDAEGDLDINHAWNAVKVDGGWFLVDATWGAGGLRNRTFVRSVDDYFFATPPEALLAHHYPSLAKWQLIPTPIDRTTFDQGHDSYPIFFEQSGAIAPLDLVD